MLNKLTKKKKEEVVEEAAPELDTKEELLREIRDLLRAQNTNK